MGIILFGAPGSGKGTQLGMLSDYFKLNKISLGDILRAEVKKNSPLGKEVGSYMEKGLLVPDELVSQVIEANISSDDFILDGYPRNINQAEILSEIFQRKGISEPIVISLKVDEATIVDRLSKRRVCKQCLAIYHTTSMPPKRDGICDKCGSELVQRNDDKPDVIKKRWEVFSKESQQVLKYYEEKGKLVVIDGKGNKVEIFERIKEQVECKKL